MAPSITENEKQIFQDIADTGMLHSLKALSKLSHRQWSAFPHRFVFMENAELYSSLPRKEPARFGGDLVIKGDIPMSILFTFPQESAMNLTHFITGTEDGRSTDLPSMQLLAVAEVTNILGNRFLGVIANTLRVRILPSEPRSMLATRRNLLEAAATRAGLVASNGVLADFRLESEHMAMTGDVSFLMNPPDLKTLIDKIHASPAWSAHDRGIY